MQAIEHTAAFGSQEPSWERLPAINMFSPNTVWAVSAKVTVTVPSPPPPPPPPEPFPLPFWPECIARALRAGTVAVNVPPETVTLQKNSSASSKLWNLRTKKLTSRLNNYHCHLCHWWRHNMSHPPSRPSWTLHSKLNQHY